MVDGVIVDFSTIHSISPLDVELIEILKGPSTAIFGNQGANGVISIFTKHGFYIKKGELNFIMMGYIKARKFPGLNCDKENKDILDNRTLLYWCSEAELRKDKRIIFNFLTSNIIGKFRIHCEGLLNTLPFYSDFDFEVK